MKLHADTHSGQNSVTAYGPGFVTVNGRRFEQSLLLTPDALVADWPVGSLDELVPAHLEVLLTHRCDLWLLGTGLRQRFPAPAVMRPLMDARLGIEVMDTAAACRTYNILMAEGRKVGAALIIEQP